MPNNKCKNGRNKLLITQKLYEVDRETLKFMASSMLHIIVVGANWEQLKRTAALQNYMRYFSLVGSMMRSFAFSQLVRESFM